MISWSFESFPFRQKTLWAELELNGRDEWPVGGPKGLWVWQQAFWPGEKLGPLGQETFSWEEQVFAAEK